MTALSRWMRVILGAMVGLFVVSSLLKLSFDDLFREVVKTYRGHQKVNPAKRWKVAA